MDFDDISKSIFSLRCLSCRGGELGVLRVRVLRTSAPAHRQKHPLKIKEKLCKILCDTKIEQKYGYLRLNLGK